MLVYLYTCLLAFASRPPDKTAYATGAGQTDSFGRSGHWILPQCNNDCASANDGVCDDGSPTGSCGSGVCACGSDCNDCGLSECAQVTTWGPNKVPGVDGWTRMEGGGQGPGGRFEHGAWGNPPGYTYHHGAVQTCHPQNMWYNDDGRTCNTGGLNQCSSCTCACQYGVCPVGYEMNVGTGDSGYWSGGDYGNRRRYPYPKGHFYPDQCPCKLTPRCPDAYILTNGRCIPRKCGDIEPTQSGQSVFVWASPKVYKSGKNANSPCGTAHECIGNCWDDRLCGNPSSAVQAFAANYAANTACGTANQCAGNCFRARECGALPAGQLYKPVATPLWPGQTYDANMACGTQSDCNSKCSANRVCGAFSDVSGAGVTNVYCTNNNPHAYSNQASAAACQATCDSDTTCKYVVHWQDGGCQRFSSATGCTVGQSTASWTADAKIYQCEPAAQQGLCGEPPAGKMFKIFTFPTPWNLHGSTDMQPTPTTTEASLNNWGAYSSGCFETGKVCVGDRTVMEAKAEQCVWVTGNLQAHRVGFPDPDAEVELPYLKRIGDISPTGGGVGDMTVLYSVGNSGKLEVLKMPNLLRVEGSFRVEANRDPHPLPLAKYNDFKIRVVEAPKLTYANRVTVYDTPELETLKLDALKYTRFELKISKNKKLATLNVANLEKVGEDARSDFLRIFDNEKLFAIDGFPSTMWASFGGQKLTSVTDECAMAPAGQQWTWASDQKACPDKPDGTTTVKNGEKFDDDADDD